MLRPITYMDEWRIPFESYTKGLAKIPLVIIGHVWKLSRHDYLTSKNTDIYCLFNILLR